ncbi:TPA: hypothetical protein HA253_06740 [Candidatus Woesearchaeota archaeon]|nr:hypothetical protein [Candidatus Woesearchaeota archaeon]
METNNTPRKPKDFLTFMVEKANAPDTPHDVGRSGNQDPKEIEQITNKLKKGFGRL